MLRLEADVRRSHYDAGGAPVRDPGSTGMNRGSIGDDRDEPRIQGLHRESIKMFNISGMNRESPGKTGAAPAPGTIGTAPGTTGAAPKPALCRNATGIHWGSDGALPATTEVKVSTGGVTVYRGSAGTLPAFTGAQPGHYRRHRGYAATLSAFTGALTATTGALPGLHRDKP
ncbi:hypothetical protein DPMN_012722 [Dreissena polymorpha]|uniref:Uncharacterized protein n=1 Tax=Dreissena polymorpha TaxID=45954 RepID=A0A9D4N2Y4_DREPO|nr:hypothetical protein DPMN_012722 [Dreissena polymorpha]